jgi:hypothetical protein
MRVEHVMMMDIVELVRLYREDVGYGWVALVVGLIPNSERKPGEVLQSAGLLGGSPQAPRSEAVLRQIVEVAMPSAFSPAVESSALP